MGDMTDDILNANEHQRDIRLGEMLRESRRNGGAVSTRRTERLARAALQATEALRVAMERDDRWAGELNDGTVVKFKHKFDRSGMKMRKAYTYVAIRVNGGWYLTGKTIRCYSDEEFIDFVGDARVYKVATWEKL